MASNTPTSTEALYHPKMIAYNCTEDSQYAQYWDFTGIHYFFQQLAAKEEFDSFFNSTLPFIVKVLDWPL